MKLAVEWSQILLAVAATIGIVPLGVAATSKAIKRHRKRQNAKWLGNVVPAVVISVIIAGVLFAQRDGRQ